MLFDWLHQKKVVNLENSLWKAGVKQAVGGGGGIVGGGGDGSAGGTQATVCVCVWGATVPRSSPC